MTCYVASALHQRLLMRPMGTELHTRASALSNTISYVASSFSITVFQCFFVLRSSLLTATCEHHGRYHLMTSSQAYINQIHYACSDTKSSQKA